MTVSKLYLYNFSELHVVETFFYVCVGKTTCFYFCPYFHKAFLTGHVLKNSVICEQNPRDEVICCCIDCRKQIISVTCYFEKLNDDFFDKFKKILSQYFFAYDRWHVYN